MAEHRRFSDSRLVVASHNPGKVKEIGELLGQFSISVVSAGDLDLPEPEETGLTFEANAELKALAAATASNLPALADDSGLSVKALDGAPGIYSARWGGPGKDFNLAMKRVNEELEAKGTDDRSAEFVCVLTLAWPDGHMESFRGTVKGSIVWPAKGDRGFGYDPIFQAEGMTQTFAEIEPAEKHAMSHRANAFQQLVNACFD